MFILGECHRLDTLLHERNMADLRISQTLKVLRERSAKLVVMATFIIDWFDHNQTRE
jgi:hypothetical protein